MKSERERGTNQSLDGPVTPLVLPNKLLGQLLMQIIAHCREAQPDTRSAWCETGQRGHPLAVAAPCQSFARKPPLYPEAAAAILVPSTSVILVSGDRAAEMARK